ncbi:hypothetical protein SLEP1_g8761 [Rubroshorea leprosula]|uniref:Uncharacterized protein n=1 Tax=Rubroshorea leprosula TaxID=152421 RepID=A0AAV5IBV5_9ROSI|nr:hypothetical protein SLEP1_g8761 [Rubroshorea leprosula]
MLLAFSEQTKGQKFPANSSDQETLEMVMDRAMLELDQILWANEINFAILAALPGFFLSLILIMSVYAWLKQDTRAEGRGRVARIQRRLLIVEVEKTIMKYLTYLDQQRLRSLVCS